MVYNKLLPDGDLSARILDDNTQENFRAAEEDGLEPEHDFSTGGTQTGRHKFAIDARTTLEANAEYVAGSIALANDVCSTGIVPIFKDDDDPAVWWDILAPYLANANLWTAGQSITPVTLTSGANIASDWSESNIFFVDLAHNGQLDNPDNMPSAGDSGVWFYIVQQYDGSGYQLTYGSKFYAPGLGTTTGPLLRVGNNAYDVLICTLRPSGGIEIASLSYSTAADTTDAGITRYATDVEAAAMEEGEAALTPSNLSAPEMGTGTGSSGWCYLMGHNSGAYGQNIMQWLCPTTASSPETFTWPIAFASSAYTVLCSAAAGEIASWSSRTQTTIAISNTGGSGEVIGIRGIGNIADI